MATQKKIDEVAMLTDKFSKAKAVVFADYSGIKHKQLEELRRTLKKNDAELVVSKNRMMLRALKDKAATVQQYLENSTAAVFAYGDQAAPVKELLKFFKGVEKGKAKAGLLGESLMDQKGITRLSELPSKEVLLGRLARQLQAPMQGLHYALSWNLNRFVWALNAVKEKKG